MKYSLLTTLLASAGIAQYAVARSMLVVVTTTNNGQVTGFGDTNNPNVAHISPPMMFHEAGPQDLPPTGRRPCSSRANLRAAALRLSNAIKQALGLPQAEVHPTAHPGIGDGFVHALPFVGADGGEIGTPDMEDDPRGHHRHHHHHHHHHLNHKKAFLRRIHHALMSLGPWEGRAVAFVLGCGIGVLLRMFWVMTVIFYRLVRGEREEHRYIQIVCESDVEDLVLPPPQYIQEKSEFVEAAVDSKKQVDQV